MRDNESSLALHGGKPVREKLLPYGRQDVDASDREALLQVLASDWLTTGPLVQEFEKAFAAKVDVPHAVAVSNGTAALHSGYFAIGLSAGDEIIVPAMTFAATANAAVYLGAKPIFADVEADTLLIDPKSVEERITPKTRAIVAVDYAGQPCNYSVLRKIADRNNIPLIADGCHALGGSRDGKPVGALADLTAFSFHPVKPITSAEGGMVVTSNPLWADRARKFRNHGMSTDFRQREQHGSWFYELNDLGYNYRLSDLHCALGLAQLNRLDAFIHRRQAIARQYDDAFASITQARPLAVKPGVSHAYHLYVIRLNLEALKMDRQTIFTALRAEGIGVNVHYIPVHLHPFYRNHFNTGPGLCPVSEKAYSDVLSLPLYAGMTDRDVRDVLEAVHKVFDAC